MAAPLPAGIGKADRQPQSDGRCKEASSSVWPLALKGITFMTRPAAMNGAVSQSHPDGWRSRFQAKYAARRARRRGRDSASRTRWRRPLRMRSQELRKLERKAAARPMQRPPRRPGCCRRCGASAWRDHELLPQASEYSRANSRDSESRSPRRLTATRNASSSSRPASLRPRPGSGGGLRVHRRRRHATA